jgi:hypothetical protein
MQRTTYSKMGQAILLNNWKMPGDIRSSEISLGLPKARLESPPWPGSK